MQIVSSDKNQVNFHMKTYVVGTHQKRLIEALLMSTHNIHFCGEIIYQYFLVEKGTLSGAIWQWSLLFAAGRQVFFSLVPLHNSSHTLIYYQNNLRNGGKIVYLRIYFPIPHLFPNTVFMDEASSDDFWYFKRLTRHIEFISPSKYKCKESLNLNYHINKLGHSRKHLWSITLQERHKWFTVCTQNIGLTKFIIMLWGLVKEESLLIILGYFFLISP